MKINLPAREDVMNAIDSMRTVAWEWLKSLGVVLAVIACTFAFFGSIIYCMVEYTLVTSIVIVVACLLVWFIVELDTARTNRENQ